MIDDILKFNEEFVSKKEYEKYQTDKFPKKKLAILTCMDTRLINLLPAALNLNNGDVKIIKNAGAIVTSDYGSVMRSLVVAIYELGVSEIMVVGHTGCGMHNLSYDSLEKKILSRVDKEEFLKSANEVDLKTWLQGFSSEEEQIKKTVEKIKKHKLIPDDILISGSLINPVTGKLSKII